MHLGKNPWWTLIKDAHSIELSAYKFSSSSRLMDYMYKAEE